MSEHEHKLGLATHNENDERIGMSDDALVESVIDHLRYSFAKNKKNASYDDLYLATGLAIRDRLIHRWMKTMKRYYETDAKRVYYLSAEYLIGRSMGNNLMNMGLTTKAKNLFEEYSIDLGEVESREPDPGRRTWQRRARTACRLFPRFTRHARLPRHGLRHTL